MLLFGSEEEFFLPSKKRKITGSADAVKECKRAREECVRTLLPIGQMGLSLCRVTRNSLINTRLRRKWRTFINISFFVSPSLFQGRETWNRWHSILFLQRYPMPYRSSPIAVTFPMCGNIFLCLLCTRSFVPVSIVLSFKFDQYARAAFKFEYGGKNSSNVEEIPVQEDCGSVWTCPMIQVREVPTWS